ncbi:MAG: hypothetical protein KAV87_14925 [Desulfobacteraceae bacterium]|nr:hypothetical protein [Desulfobacteraceae bacterium]
MKRSRTGLISGERKQRIRSRLPETREVWWFRERLRKWFSKNRRSFPWRTSTDAYIICIAEVFLQQTSAAKVAELIGPFAHKYPSWTALAAATVEEIESAIHPLGLFRRRAQTLHRLANAITQTGELPRTRQGLENLPGIGQYIANVLLVVLQHKREPFLDVNMSRVLERFFGPREMADIRDDPFLQILARKIMNVRDVLEANWMILDFAAIICLKRKPRCLDCPLFQNCQHVRKPVTSTR